MEDFPSWIGRGRAFSGEVLSSCLGCESMGVESYCCALLGNAVDAIQLGEKLARVVINKGRWALRR